MNLKKYRDALNIVEPSKELETETLQRMDQAQKKACKISKRGRAARRKVRCCAFEGSVPAWAAAFSRPAAFSGLALAVLCLFLLLPIGVIAGGRLFSSLEEDDLRLQAVYEGEGIVSVYVKNDSDRELRFMPELKLMRWNLGEEIPTLSKEVTFSGETIAAGSAGVMTLDLSRAYDVEMLEKPLTDDWYYLVLTNNHFLFGHDWMCSVDFALQTAGAEGQDAEVGEQAEKEFMQIPECAEDLEGPSSPEISENESISVEASTDSENLQKIEEKLRAYFEADSRDVTKRREWNAEYVEMYTKLFQEKGITPIPSVSPVLPGNRINSEMPYLSVMAPAEGVIFDEDIPAEDQYQLVSSHWSPCDADFKLLAAEGEYALKLSVSLPLKKYDADTSMPLFYILSYEKSAIGSQEDHVFIYGRLLTFSELEALKVYEDERHVCYEVSSLIYSDLEAYTERFVGQNEAIRCDAQTWERVKNIYDHYKENLGKMLYYKPPQKE